MQAPAQDSEKHIILEYNGLLDLHQLLTFVAAKHKETIVSACGACITGRRFVEICLNNTVDLSDIERNCAEFSSLHSKHLTVLRESNAVKHISKIVAKAKADGRVLPWTPENGLQRMPTVFGEMLMDSEPKRRHDILGIVESCCGEHGKVDFTLVKRLSPAAKHKLMYSQLNEGNAVQFCDDAACTVLENILMECAKSNSNFRQLDLDIPCRLITEIADREDIASGLALSILIHSSKCSSLERARKFLMLVDDLHRSALKIVKPDGNVMFLVQKAKAILGTPEYSRILLANTSITDVSIIKDMNVYFVEIDNEEIRGWAGPSSVVVNMNGLKKTMHLKRHGPLTILIGHEIRHVILRMIFGGDLNFSSPEKPNEACPSLPCKMQGSGYWFEVKAVGAKFRFPLSETASRFGTAQLIDAIEKSFDEGRAPALSPEQICQFARCLRPPNLEMAFDYESESEID